MLLPDGDYPFEVSGAEDKESQKGDEMIALELRLFKADGSARSQKDWLVSSSHPLNQMKIRHFARSCNLMQQYESGELDSMAVMGASGIARIKSKTDPQYGPQNFVADYIHNEEESEPAPPPGPTAAQAKRANDAAADDDIPF